MFYKIIKKRETKIPHIFTFACFFFGLRNLKHVLAPKDCFCNKCFVFSTTIFREKGPIGNVESKCICMLEKLSLRFLPFLAVERGLNFNTFLFNKLFWNINHSIQKVQKTVFRSKKRKKVCWITLVSQINSKCFFPSLGYVRLTLKWLHAIGNGGYLHWKPFGVILCSLWRQKNTQTTWHSPKLCLRFFTKFNL